MFLNNNKLKDEGVVYLSNALMHENCKLTELNPSFLMDEFALKYSRKSLSGNEGNSESIILTNSIILKVALNSLMTLQNIYVIL
mgnify:CR=1 FL=1